MCGSAGRSRSVWLSVVCRGKDLCPRRLLDIEAHECAIRREYGIKMGVWSRTISCSYRTVRTGTRTERGKCIPGVVGYGPEKNGRPYG